MNQNNTMMENTENSAMEAPPSLPKSDSTPQSETFKDLADVKLEDKTPSSSPRELKEECSQEKQDDSTADDSQTSSVKSLRDKLGGQLAHIALNPRPMDLPERQKSVEGEEQPHGEATPCSEEEEQTSQQERKLIPISLGGIKVGPGDMTKQLKIQQEANKYAKPKGQSELQKTFTKVVRPKEEKSELCDALKKQADKVDRSSTASNEKPSELQAMFVKRKLSSDLLK